MDDLFAKDITQYIHIPSMGNRTIVLFLLVPIQKISFIRISMSYQWEVVLVPIDKHPKRYDQYILSMGNKQLHCFYWPVPIRCLQTNIPPPSILHKTLYILSMGKKNNSIVFTTLQKTSKSHQQCPQKTPKNNPVVLLLIRCPHPQNPLLTSFDREKKNNPVLDQSPTLSQIPQEKSPDHFTSFTPMSSAVSHVISVMFSRGPNSGLIGKHS